MSREREQELRNQILSESSNLNDPYNQSIWVEQNIIRELNIELDNEIQLTNSEDSENHVTENYHLYNTQPDLAKQLTLLGFSEVESFSENKNIYDARNHYSDYQVNKWIYRNALEIFIYVNHCDNSIIRFDWFQNANRLYVTNQINRKLYIELYILCEDKSPLLFIKNLKKIIKSVDKIIDFKLQPKSAVNVKNDLEKSINHLLFVAGILK